MSDELRKRAEQLSDEDLLNMIDKNPADFTPDALAAAEAEAQARGGKEHLYQKIESEIESQMQQQQLDDEERWEELANESWQGDLSGKRTLKDETILEVAYFMLRGASGHSQKLVDSIQRKLEESRMPCPARWGVVEVQTKGWISRVRRDFLVVAHDDFPDYHQYVAIRDFGIYLDSIRVFTVEPGFIKKFIAKKLSGDPEGLSAPKNVLKHHDLHSWNVVVNDCVRLAMDELVEELGKKPNSVRSGTKTFLDIW